MSQFKAILDEHDSIAWDIDGTLLYVDDNMKIREAAHSAYFRQYIIDNPQKKHYIVTFRDPAWAGRVFTELESLGMEDARSHFEDVHACPVELHDAWQLRSASPATVTHYGFTHAEVAHAVSNFPLWKGMASNALGATILVDDMPTWVEQGCAKHNVDLLDITGMRHLKGSR
jgi:hypothetical protein